MIFVAECHFLLEEVISDCWKKDNHIEWLDISRKVIADLGVSDTEALALLQKVLDMSKTLSPAAVKLFVKLAECLK